MAYTRRFPGFSGAFVGNTIFAALMLSTVCLPNTSRAEEVSIPALHAGAWATEFEVDPDFNYGFGYTSTVVIAVKRHHSAGSAFRLGAGIGFNEGKAEGTARDLYYYPPYDSTDVTRPIERHTTGHNYIVFAHWVRERALAEAFSFFAEAGPSFQYVSYKQTEQSVGPGPDPFVVHDETIRVQRTVALDARIGFEWFFARRLSLGARYGALVAYDWGPQLFSYDAYNLSGDYHQLRQDFEETHNVRVTTTRAVLTLAAYF